MNKTKIKICGISRMEDVYTVNRVLPDFIGFVFAPSKRRLEIDAAARLKEKLEPQIDVVGVFVNEDIDVIARIYREGIIDLVQLHGDENGEYIRRLKDTCGCRVIKAVGVGNALPVLPVDADHMLFDSISKQRGGAGKAFDWELLEGFHGPPFFLSGGLSADNVLGAIRLLAPYCVDVSSGVETDGVKDAEKIEKFIDLIRKGGIDNE